MNDLLLLFLTVPVITAVIGWITNLAAVKMIFFPERFVGIGPFGWQGILFRQSEKLASGIADMAVNNLITPKEIAERIDPDKVEEILADDLDASVAQIAEEVAEKLAPGSWASMPDHVKQMIIGQARLKSSDITKDVFNTMRDHADDLIDLRGLVVSRLTTSNATVLAKLTKKIGATEFKFIELYGGVFGLIIGIAQIGVWSLMQQWWLMPVVGLVVGIVTNWLAIQMIFRPHEPKTIIGPIKYQGLFPKRQAEIAADYGESAAAELLTPEHFINLLTNGEAGAKAEALLRETVEKRVESEWKNMSSMVPLTLTDEQLSEVKDLIETRMREMAPKFRPKLESYLAEAFDIENTVRSRLAELPKDRFERILRGVFEEDEITLILVGGALGLAVGFAQAAIVTRI